MKKIVELFKRQCICLTIGLLCFKLLAAQDPIWDANKIILITKQIAPDVYGVFPENDFDDKPNAPKGTSGGFIVGKNGVLVIESFLNADLAGQMISQIRKVTQLPIKFLVNTSYHGDHSYGNYIFPAGTTIIQHKATSEYVRKNFSADTVWMMQNFGKGRGIEKVVPRTGDILIDTDLSVDLGGRQVQIMTFGFGQTPGDLYVWDPTAKTLWTGNVIVCPEPGIPWLLDGRHAEVLNTLKKIRDFLPDDAIIVPGHYKPIRKSEIDFSINYLQALHDGVKKGIEQHQTLDQIVASLKMQEFNKGYPIWNWLQFQVNIPNTYKDLKAGYASVSGNRDIADMIVYNAAITTQNDSMPSAEAVAIKNGLIAAVGTNDNIMKWKGDNTKLIDAGKRRLIPGLNDSHSHYLRGGLSFTTELRWDGVPSLKEGLEMIKKQAEITPAGQWVRIVGGFTPWQFEEKRLPTPDELTAVAPNTPVYIQYFYSVIITNKKGLESLHVTRETPAAPGSRIEKDAKGNPTGLFIADPNPALFYGLLGQLPKMDEATAENSTQYMFHELARFGLTSVIDAGGGGFNYPGDYKPPVTTVKEDKLPLRVSFFLFTQHPGKELDDYQNWIKENTIGANLDESREHGFELGGAGEWVLWKAGDFENFRSPRPTQDSDMEAKLEPVISLFVQKRWPFRIHATYDESINRLLNVIEKINQKTPLNGLRWSIEHGETLKEKNIDRIKTLGGGVAIQDRMFFLGDDFVKRYGAEVAATAPPVRLLLQKGIPVGMGTDGTRSSFNPWLGLYFLTTGKVASGKKVLGKDNILSREEALKLYSWGSAWFSQEETVKGKIKQGQYADFALLSKDYFQVREEEIKSIESVLTVVDGKPVYGTGDFKNYSPVLPPILPAWSPLRSFGSFYIKKRN